MTDTLSPEAAAFYSLSMMSESKGDCNPSDCKISLLSSCYSPSDPRLVIRARHLHGGLCHYKDFIIIGTMGEYIDSVMIKKLVKPAGPWLRSVHWQIKYPETGKWSDFID